MFIYSFLSSGTFSDYRVLSLEVGERGRDVRGLVMSDLLEINNIQYEEIWNGKGIQQTLKKASYIILGACIYTIYNLDRRMKKPNLAAARNSSLLMLKAFAKTRQGKKYIQGVHNTPFFALIKNLF